ncbi:MAG TPA: nitrous oxide reductase family maturation protein NosD [Candidatus Babeliaceae bacterium]|nr:nitrous oxide reductase family maturation protein NosD [Candidatus Babeliaceae bacterium]
MKTRPGYMFLIGLLLWAIKPDARASTIVVHPSLRIKSIEEALRIAKTGDTILVRSFRYSVENLLIDKAIVLIGEHFPILDGGMKGDVLIIKANHVVIRGFHICNTNKGSLKNYAGIRCDQASDILIDNNRLNNTLFPIYLPRAHRCIIKNNIITGNSGSIESGSGIYLWYASDILVQNNSISGQRDGIYLEFSKESTITHNVSQNNYRYGLHFMFSDKNIYSDNIFRNNGSGVAVMYSKEISMLRNTFDHNWGPAAYGLLLKEINDSRVEGNIFNYNTTGIFMESCSRNLFLKNKFSENGWAINFLADCVGDQFNRNDFIGNTFDISTNGAPEENTFNENYWDKYDGYDLNRDGLGDIPYYPVSLYAKIIDNVPYAIILLHSFIVDLFDRAEHSVPTLVPISIVDVRPLMKPAAIYVNPDRKE